jgi:hypothetical protein
MDDKLKKIAIKLQNTIKYEGGDINPQAILNTLTKLFKTQSEYFSNYSPIDLLALTFYIYSYKKTKNFELGDKILNEIAFVGFIYTSNNNSVITCNHCGGEGTINCGDCYGTGRIDCRNCDDGYNEHCSECYEDENHCTCEEGFSESYCDYCGGEGEIECPSCSSDGQERCEFCDGSGQIESESLVECTTFNTCTWNRDILINSELRNGEPIPVFNSDKPMPNTIFLDFFDTNLELGFNLQPDELYCYDFDEDPNLVFDKNFEIKILNRDKLSKFLV